MQTSIVQVDRAFFCDSPFEVFTSVHMRIHDGIESDMYILDSFRDAQNIVQKLRQTSVFRKTILINSDHLYKKEKSLKKRSIKRSVGTFLTYFRVDSIVSNYLDKDTKYKTMFFTCNQLSFRLARFYYIKKDYDTEFVLFDEGAGSYDGHFEKVKFTDRLIRTILFGEKADNRNLKLYLYQPELYFDYIDNKYRLYKIPAVDEMDVANIETYKDLFGDISGSNRRKCIFFDSLREEICFSEYALNKLADWFELIESIIGEKNLYIKSHPRAYGRYPHKCEEYSTNSPMEVNYMSMDLDKMCLVSLLSTAVTTPKMIYDKEPYVVLLCNVDHNVYKPREKLLGFYKKIKGLYKDPSRFMIPENEEELKDCLDVLAEKLKA